MTHIVYTLKGDPTPLARPRFGGRYNKPTVYDSQANLRLISGIQIKEQHGDRPSYVGPLELNVVFFFPAYKPFRKKKVSHGDWYTQVPDLSNMVKYIEDVCESVGLYKNDSFICSIICKKYFGVQAETQFYFIELNSQPKESYESISLRSSRRDKDHSIITPE